MRITVENFGPIREAKDIRISPLTMFVGPSNSGKSYLAAVINSVIEAASESFVDPLPEIDGSEIKDAEAKRFFMGWAKSMQQIWKGRIAYYLGEEGENIAKSRSMRVIMYSDDDDIVIDLCQPQKSRISKTHLNNLVARAGKKQVEYRIDYSPSVKIFIRLAEELCVELFGNEWVRSYYLPAVRGAVMQSYRAIVDQSIRRASEFGTRHGNTSSMFSGIFGDFTRRLIDIDKKEKGGKEIIAINKILESNILHGRINVIFPDIGLPEFRYVVKGKKGDMAINNVSASVAELAPLSVFMRYYLNPRNLLIWEEPEMNLYPQAQRDIADIMVRLANAGVLVLATTHSDIVLEQIDNAYRASQLKDAGKDRRLLGDHEPLDTSKELAVYSFIESSKGTKVEKVEKVDFGHMTEAMTKYYLDAVQSLYNQTVRSANSENNEQATNDGKKTVSGKV